MQLILQPLVLLCWIGGIQLKIQQSERKYLTVNGKYLRTICDKKRDIFINTLVNLNKYTFSTNHKYPLANMKTMSS